MKSGSIPISNQTNSADEPIPVVEHGGGVCPLDGGKGSPRAALGEAARPVVVAEYSESISKFAERHNCAIDIYTQIMISEKSHSFRPPLPHKIYFP